MIEAENASFTYQSAPSSALQDVALTVQPGECVVLCGRSGCGKTTFTHLLNGLSPEFYPGTLTGRCTAAGLAAGEAAIEAYVPQVGSVFQNPKTQYFNVDTTAELAFPCENAGMEPQAIRRRVDEVVEQFQLGPLMDRSVFKLSGGEKQRVAFAAACMLGPRLLVLDEPTSNLDAAAIAQLHDMIAVMKRQGVTVVLAEHRLAWITDLADRYFFFAAAAWPRSGPLRSLPRCLRTHWPGTVCAPACWTTAAPESAQSRAPDAPVRRCSRWRASRWAATKSTRCAPCPI